jgi:ribonuclease HII
MIKRGKILQSPNVDRENRLRLKGYKLVAGIDEAGRGSLAGPVVAGAVILPLGHLPWLQQVRDSKEISPRKREYLSAIIAKEVLGVGVGVVSPGVIDSINILQATYLAMERAIRNLPFLPDFLLVDGLNLPHCRFLQEGIIKGDKLSLSIACASIIAKVSRDHIMEKLDKIYPGYGFAKHKGYGTREHIFKLQRLGPSVIHRQSFAPVRRCIENFRGVVLDEDESARTW